jgi:hypothetical protein
MLADDNKDRSYVLGFKVSHHVPSWACPGLIPVPTIIQGAGVRLQRPQQARKWDYGLLTGNARYCFIG